MSKRGGKQQPADDPVQEFLEAVRDVTPLPQTNRVTHAGTPPAPVPFQRLQDDRQVLRDSLSDQIPAELELETGEALSFARPNVSRQELRKLRAGHWAIQDQLDLHGMRTDGARTLLADFLALAVKRGLRCVLVVHGKGFGSNNGEPVLRRKVASWLAQRGNVLAFCQARPGDGGSGAVVILLKGVKTRTVDADASDTDED
ncbi:MAG: Smr/MutS family protein [Betaproteobacteria bacterium]